MQNDATNANPLFDQLHATYKRLRDTPAGREAIATLMDDEIVAVRMSAAAHSLSWHSARAIKVLEQIERDGHGLYGITAKYTLKSFREGKLNLDW